VVHRHEPPVTQQPIHIIHDDPNMLVIDKPPSIPVHPSGRFRHNSVVFILAKEHGYSNLHLVHRIDRLTSGLLLLGKNAQVAGEISKKVRKNQVIKQYLARVHGKFQLEKIDVNQPIKVAVKGRGINTVSPQGKPARTLFKGIIYDQQTNTSLVICRLYTGRTHQIRVHLQWLGYPVVNDPLYNLEGEDKLDKVFNDLNQQRFANTEPPPSTNQPSKQGVEHQNSDVSQTVVNPVEDIQLNTENDNSILTEVERECLDCRAHFEDPRPEDMVQYLHAYSYKTSSWSFTTKLPSWAALYGVEEKDIPDLTMDV